ncbi:ParB/RepB/Spo0J family partition protein [Ornithinimicrobium pratense]|uniref:ParB/RepB/Spo0J family partition protein n=1 Tax=Ornithinimicrobium pratense TaxID=2593973 RepID=A0A5J6VA02_9MICO|nr:ParB/RepB/Spo0J family partition protein [Ornithinimicrobium pratense]QFG70043.1 ParB/RepB/Spo0J family partition protein [Ornithinimicrobium pratense]
MNERRRGLGKGLGALIPSAPTDQDRPRDVFFPRGEDRGAAALTEGALEASSGFTGNGDGARETSSGFTGNSDDSTARFGSVGRAAPPEPAAPDLPGGDGSLDGLAPVPGATFAEVLVEDIRPNPRQPREVFDEDELAELVRSIEELGVLQPVVLRRVSEDEVAGGESPFELVMGERRLRASKAAGRQTIPAIVRATEDEHMLRDALLENLHRAQLNPLEEAAAYQQLLEDFGCTHEELATRIGRSRPQISNTIRLLKLPPMVARRVASGVLSAGHARALLGLPDGAAMERLAQRIVAEGLSVRSVEEIVLVGDQDPGQARRPARRAAASPELQEVAERLSDRFETRVQVAMGRRKGRITVEFAGQEDLARILGMLDQE